MGTLLGVVALFFIGKMIMGLVNEKEGGGRTAYDIKIDLIVIVVIFMIILVNN
jgi:hypothetical protein